MGGNMSKQTWPILSVNHKMNKNKQVPIWQTGTHIPHTNQSINKSVNKPIYQSINKSIFLSINTDIFILTSEN